MRPRWCWTVSPAGSFKARVRSVIPAMAPATSRPRQGSSIKPPPRYRAACPSSRDHRSRVGEVPGDCRLPAARPPSTQSTSTTWPSCARSWCAWAAGSNYLFPSTKHSPVSAGRHHAGLFSPRHRPPCCISPQDPIMAPPLRHTPFPMFVLGPYQTDAVNAVIRHFRKHPDPAVVVLPTGAGKSLRDRRAGAQRPWPGAGAGPRQGAGGAEPRQVRGLRAQGRHLRRRPARKEASAQVVFGPVQSVARNLAAFDGPFPCSSSTSATGFLPMTTASTIR